ncbi:MULTISPECIES: sensor histidine kinase [unclassified Lebetimonas]|uniref:sensor histidine kinase n=1 Tax=unclassified Lebetimonas TaxID=2648158 RepID=UPI0004645184|nr:MULTISPECIES: HAMP domain-containing sensor histidine kinase [unclassified Lebetimonas]
MIKKFIKTGFLNKTKLIVSIISILLLSIIFMSQYTIFSFKNDIDILFQKRLVSSVKLSHIKDLYKINIYETINQYKRKEIGFKEANNVIKLANILIQKEWNNYLETESIPKNTFEYLIFNNIKTLKKEIDNKLNKFLTTREINIQKLSNNINLINIYLSNLININLKKAIIQKNNTDKKFSFAVKASIISIIIVFIITITLIFLIIEKFKNINTLLEKKVEEKTKELQIMNKTLEKRIEKKINEIRKKDKIMFQQSKLAAMGEMLQNIAHQWRQPLANLSMIIESFQIKNELGKLDNKYIENKTKEALMIAENMSKTIEDFRNFFKPDKVKKRFSLKECLEKTQKLLSFILQKNNIDLKIDIKKDIKILGYPNELSHVCINFITNAIEALINSDIKEKKILITVKETKKDIIISIIDNAGGIDESVMDKIFEPYFTTKTKQQGTGIGLYMAEQIISFMEGKIKAKNIIHKMCTKKFYKCAMFEIILPKANNEKL